LIFFQRHERPLEFRHRQVSLVHQSFQKQGLF
jgi:hypothetical protein